MSKSVAIITRHAVPNYGSFLQAYATQEVIKSMGYIPTIIDYRRKDELPKNLAKNYYKSKGNGIKYYIYYNYVWRLSNFIANRLFIDARKKYLRLSELTFSNDFCKDYTYDCYVTGSDQVWNKVGSGITESVDGAYFWSTIPSSKRIISYAASIVGLGLTTGLTAFVSFA